MDFNKVEEFLRSGGSAEEIAQAFADKLNAVLTRIEEEKAVGEKSHKVTEIWNDFVDAYFAVNTLPENTANKDFYLTDEDIMKLIETFVQIVPMIVKYGSAIENFTTSAEKVLNTKIDKNAFSETMDNFFRKLNI